MAEGYSGDLTWASEYNGQIADVLARYLTPYLTPTIRLATFREDLHESTDMRMVGDANVGLRVRRSTWYERHRDEFTLRISRPSGTQTEVDKIRSGWCDFYFYGFAAVDSDPKAGFAGWSLLDCRVMRAAWDEQPWLLSRSRENADGSSSFTVQNLHSYPYGLVLARSHWGWPIGKRGAPPDVTPLPQRTISEEESEYKSA